MYYYRLISSMLKAVISSLGTGLYAVYKATGIVTTLNTSIFRVYNGDNVNDSSGNAQNGTNVGSVTFTTGKIGNAFTFNGSNYISLPNDSLNTLTGDFSISMWVNIVNTGYLQGLFTNFAYNGTAFYGIAISNYGNNRIQIYNGTGTGITLQTADIVNYGAWEHLVVTRKLGTGTKIYRNGSLSNSDTNTINPVYSSGNMRPSVGAFSYGPLFSNLVQYYAGNGTKIDALTIWDKELTGSEVTALYNGASGLEYPFSTAITIDSANDSLGNYDGTQVGGLTYTAGISGNAFTFNGVNSAIRLPVNSMNFTNDFSISTWVNIPSGYTGSIIILWNVNGEFFNNPKGFRLGIYSTDVNFTLFNGTNTYNSLIWSDAGQTIIKPNSGWVHIVAVRKKSTSSKIYVNGVLKASNTNVNDAVYSSTYQTPNIGNAYMLNSSGTVTNNDTWAFNGSKIDELNTWTKELTATEVTELYNAGAGKFYPY